jgi:hypothetical protein
MGRPRRAYNRDGARSFRLHRRNPRRAMRRTELRDRLRALRAGDAATVCRRNLGLYVDRGPGAAGGSTLRRRIVSELIFQRCNLGLDAVLGGLGREACEAGGGILRDGRECVGERRTLVEKILDAGAP